MVTQLKTEFQAEREDAQAKMNKVINQKIGAETELMNTNAQLDKKAANHRQDIDKLNQQLDQLQAVNNELSIQNKRAVYDLEAQCNDRLLQLKSEHAQFISHKDSELNTLKYQLAEM